MLKQIFTTLFLLTSVSSYSQDCGEFNLFNFTDTLVTATSWFEEPQPGFYFDMTLNTTQALNTGYTSFFLVDGVGDTITNKEYYAWSHVFPNTSTDTLRYTMVLDGGLTSIPPDFDGHLVTANPECYIPLSLDVLSAHEVEVTPSVEVYPNPTVHTLYIKGVLAPNTQLYLYDYTGQLLLHQSDALSLDVAAIPQGLYVLKIQTEKAQPITKKIIKQ